MTTSPSGAASRCGDRRLGIPIRGLISGSGAPNQAVLGENGHPAAGRARAKPGVVARGVETRDAPPAAASRRPRATSDQPEGLSGLTQEAGPRTRRATIATRPNSATMPAPTPRTVPTAMLPANAATWGRAPQQATERATIQIPANPTDDESNALRWGSEPDAFPPPGHLGFRSR